MAEGLQGVLREMRATKAIPAVKPLGQRKRKQRKKKQAQEVEETTAGKDAQNSLKGVGLYCCPSGPE